MKPTERFPVEKYWFAQSFTPHQSVTSLKTTPYFARISKFNFHKLADKETTLSPTSQSPPLTPEGVRVTEDLESSGLEPRSGDLEDDNDDEELLDR